ncbi:MAG: diguanylate cyclase, partial [Gammaproteobacteria bacterium]|nr:diguanylate cyclase [Gammaproteobacteria bacterium]
YPILCTSGGDGSLDEGSRRAGFKKAIVKKDMAGLNELLLGRIKSRLFDVAANILLVEDSKALAELTTVLFERNKQNIVHVTSIAEMKKEFSRQEFDLIISDYHLENGETGSDVISYVRGYESLIKSDTPILMVSAEANQATRNTLLEQGADDFILKPYNEGEILIRSANLIKTKRLLAKSKVQKQQLMKLALTDHLTGLYNRHSLFDIGPKYVSNAVRHKLSLALMVFDLDHFKNINDTHGHSVGDTVLHSVAGTLQLSCRAEDIVARFGGEEFVMVLTNCGLEDAAAKAEFYRKAIEESKPDGITITSSIGVAQLEAGDNFQSLFDKADEAAYQAKDGGRNMVVTATVNKKNKAKKAS